MKVLISALVTLSVGTAVAATSAAKVSNTGSSATTLEQVAPKNSKISTLVEFTNEKAQKALDNNSKDLETAIEAKATYKLSDTQSLRGSAYIQTLTREEQDDVHTNLYYMYLQYADSALFTIGDQAFRGAVRQYTTSFGDAQDEGLEAVTRFYLSTSFKVSDAVTIMPMINPRFYWGSNSRENSGAPKRDLLGILETEVAINSKVTYTLDLIHRERTNKDATNGRFELDNWATIALLDRTSFTEAISMDLGFYSLGNSGNGVTVDKNQLVYYVRANVNF